MGKRYFFIVFTLILSLSLISCASTAPLPPSSTQSLSYSAPSEEQPQYVTAEFLIDGWHESPTLGSGFSERYLFQADGLFYFTGNTMRAGDRLRYMDGNWTYENGELYLTIKRKIVIEGGIVVEGEVSFFNRIEGGEEVRYTFDADECENQTFSVREVPVDADMSPWTEKSMELDEIQFWAAPGVGYEDMPTYWDDYVYFE